MPAQTSAPTGPAGPVDAASTAAHPDYPCAAARTVTGLRCGCWTYCAADGCGGLVHAEDITPGTAPACDDHHVEPPAGSLDLGAHEVRVGSVDELDEALQALVADGTEDENGDHVLVEDFAWQLYDEPEYDWNGDLRVHVPGLPDFSAECDANGSPIIAPPVLVTLVDDATDLDALRRQIRAVTGTDHDEALHAFAPAAGAAPASAHSSTASTP